jgi:hypothetical protein
MLLIRLQFHALPNHAGMRKGETLLDVQVLTAPWELNIFPCDVVSIMEKWACDNPILSSIDQHAISQYPCYT